MKETDSRKYWINLGFEEIRLPPFEDILIIGKKSPHGRMGLSKSFQFLIPDEFEVFEVDDPIIDAAFISKRLLKKIDKENILGILEKKVFPFVSDGEIIKVDFKIKIYYDAIKGEL
ncbi:MAG: hypothetical protein PHI28_00025 [Mangrovibacterium sp.]|nr:hypothetical protein [Mangrovibacterium sp.]